ncbi:Dos2-interacting transcription regulator of RNA-Pol-II-domain-containing protein [Sporodiniella umbellata]|nr:Dos2-interacting transcription regulator of RNA-Pol-II-domain-containing protein [Sporodiniella umbellata]
MSALEKHVTEYMITTDSSSAESLEIVQQLIAAVNQGSVQEHLLQLIQCLGEYLTSDDDFIRAKATGLLSHCLMDCQQEAINESAVSVLVDFYCDRLSDKSCVQNLLNGLLALMGYEHFTSTNAVSSIKRIMERVEVQSYPQSTRNVVYRTIDQLMERYAGALKSINNEFVFGFTQILDGEKDPRNLMLAFKIVKAMVEQLDIVTHVEDLFEVTFCYFPITFKPPPDDPYGITADDLKVGLRQCLASTPYFAKLAVPLILEKLSSTSGSAKKDSMETLAACAPVYGAGALLPHMREIFNALKLEVYHATETSLEDVAVLAIGSVLSALSTGLSTDAQAPMETALAPWIEDCITRLKDPDMKEAKQTGRILQAMVSASDPACQQVVHAIVPLILKHLRETPTATLRKANLDILVALLEGSKHLYGSDEASPLIQHKERFFGLFESSLMASNEYNLLRLSGLTGMKQMVLSSGFLEPNEVALAVQAFNQLLLRPTEEGELRQAALDALDVTASVHPAPVVEETVPALMQRLGERGPKDGFVLSALRTLCPVSAIYTHSMPLLLQKLEEACVAEAREDARVIAQVILAILQAKREDPVTLAGEVPTMVRYVFHQVIGASGNAASVYLDPTLLETLALILITLFRKADSATQKVWIDRVFQAYTTGETIHLTGVSVSHFRPLDPDSAESIQRTVCLFSALVCSLRREVALPVLSMEDYLNELVTLALHSPVQTTSVSRMVGSLINQWKQDNAALTEYVQTTTLLLQDTMASNPRALEVYLWITKALLVRTHPLGYDLADRLIAWCGLGWEGVPNGFDILLAEDPLALNKATFATLSILYKQRFFSYSLPKLIQGYAAASDATKKNYLIALSYVLKNVPKQILLNELPPLIPLLIQSLALTDPSLRTSTLSTFTLAVREAPDVMAAKIEQVLPSLLNLLAENDRLSIQVRIGLLRCLTQFSLSLRQDILQPYRVSVLLQLKPALDDRKRNVRKEAVDCRSTWFAI